MTRSTKRLRIKLSFFPFRFAAETVIFCAVLVIVAMSTHVLAQDQTDDDKTVQTICTLIEDAANTAGIPPEFFARLIWKESRFDEKAVSPAGAQGIAQFMPTTAAMRNLDDAFNMTKALPASANYLAQLRDQFGNLGLAAAAYNAGETRVDRWLIAGGFLPLETENYVLTITGEPVDIFTDRSRTIRNLPVESDKSFMEGCLRLPVIPTRAPAMADTPRLPWAVQVAGNFRKSAAQATWSRVRSRHRVILEGLPVSVSRAHTAMGRRAIYAVRVGANSRQEAATICTRLRQNGGSCIVMRN
jgi:hypothetical protein